MQPDAQRVPCGSASTRANTGTRSASHSFLTISLLFTSGTPLPLNDITYHSLSFSRKRQYFEKRDSDAGRPHCNYDAGKQPRAEVIIQQPLERCILLHNQDKFSGGGNVCALIKERQANMNNDTQVDGFRNNYMTRDISDPADV